MKLTPAQIVSSLFFTFYVLNLPLLVDNMDFSFLKDGIVLKSKYEIVILHFLYFLSIYVVSYFTIKTFNFNFLLKKFELHENISKSDEIY